MNDRRPLHSGPVFAAAARLMPPVLWVIIQMNKFYMSAGAWALGENEMNDRQTEAIADEERRCGEKLS